ncbi:MAG TPA: class IV adenylate cyclase [Candidatus Paceibacterota bacterium]|nr:class IV adenylate cyclase [Candidatus Paceibacterota bacterium]
MKEIEVKAYLKNPDEVIKSLVKLGCVLSEPIRQVDSVYTKIIGNVEEYLKNDHFVRIREKSDGRFIFTVKKPLSLAVLTKAEHETEIKNAKEMEQALFLMGYQLSNRVIKNRRTTHFEEFEICIDNVDKLGSFIEIERKTNDDEELVRKDLNKFMISIGVAPEDEVHKGYDIMAVEKLFI